MLRSRFWTILASFATVAMLPSTGQAQLRWEIIKLAPTPVNGDTSIVKVYSLAGLGDDQLGHWLTDTVTELIQPATWKCNGGDGVIRYSPTSRILAVNNIPAVHGELESLLQQIKRTLPERKDSGVEQAQFIAPRSEPLTIPAPLKQPKHLFHFNIRYEGDGFDFGEMLKSAISPASDGQIGPININRPGGPIAIDPTRPAQQIIISPSAPAQEITVLPSTASTNASPVAANIKKTYTKNTTFNLPIQIADERIRAALREVQLLVKAGDGEWTRHEVVPPDRPHFTYRVPQDGEYWFALVTVDRAGKTSPADVTSPPPALRVIVDTRPPMIEASLEKDGDNRILRVAINDANPDDQSIRVAVAMEKGERNLSPLAGEMGRFRLAPSDLAATLRITAIDLSGNVTTRDVPVSDLRADGE